MIYLTQTYRDDAEGLTVESRSEQIQGSFMPGSTTFWALVQANVGGEPLPIQVPLDAQDIHEAFSVFKVQVQSKGQGIVRETIKKFEEAMRKTTLTQGIRGPLPPLNG